MNCCKLVTLGLMTAAFALRGASPDQDYISLGASEPPRLSISYESADLIIGWPLAAAGWVLEESLDLTGSISWHAVSITAAQTNATNVTLRVPGSEETMFYRLRKIVPSGATTLGLTGDWTFDGATGQVAPDSSGYGNGAKLDNVQWTSGRVGAGALWFNGGSAGAGASRASVSNAVYRVLPASGQPFSVSLWFNADALTTGWRGLVGNGTGVTNGWTIALHTSGPGTNELLFSSIGGGTLNVTGRKLLLPGQWYQLTATYDGGRGSIYVDGQILAGGNGALFMNQEAVYFGGGVGNYDSFLGRIDQVRIYTNAFSQEDVALTGKWHLNENGGAFVGDSSMHARNATLSNPAAWIDGKEGSGIDLSNSTVVVRNDFAEVLPPTGGSFSLSFWLYPKSLSPEWRGVMNCADSTNSGWQLAIAGGSGLARLHFWSTNSGGTLDLSATVPTNERLWSKVDLTFNGGIATIYVNGRKIDSSTGGIQGNTVPLVVGSVPAMPNFDGAIDELKIYRRERDETEIGPVAKVMWETVSINSSTNLVLQGFGPPGKPLTYSIVNTISPTNGTLAHMSGSSMVTYTGGATKGPDAFAYTVTDGEFTTPPTIVVMSVVQSHWLSPVGGTSPPLDGTSAEHAWVAGPAEALDAIWKTNNYYDCFFYAPGEYESSGAKWQGRRTANPGCKHIGSGADGFNRTILKLVNLWEAWNEGLFFGGGAVGSSCDSFEVRDMRLDCNAVNNPKYIQGEPVSITIPLVTNARVDSIRLRWDNSYFNGVWRFGAAQSFSVATRVPGTSEYITNRNGISSTGSVDIVSLDVETDQIVVSLQRRAAGIDFYSLAEIEVSGGIVNLASARKSDGTQSNLDPTKTDYTIVHAFDEDDRSVWASGPEAEVRLALPLEPRTGVSHIILSWNCQTINGVGRLGPATEYQIQARNATNGQYYDIPFTVGVRTEKGSQVINLGAPVITDELILVLRARELGVDYYSLRELSLWNGAAVPLKVPKALNSLTWGSYGILRAFDGNPTTQWTSDTQGMLGAMTVRGSNLKFTGLRIVGFGAKATAECFPMYISTPPTWMPPVSFGNILIEDCALSDPATNNTEGLTAVVLQMTAPHHLSNAVVRGCSVSGVKPHFRYSHAFSAGTLEHCTVKDCQVGVYFEPNISWGDSVGPVMIRSNQFVNVDYGIHLVFAAAAQFDSLTCLANEFVLNPFGGWGLADCDTCTPGPSGSTTNITVLNNVVRYADWSLRPSNYEGGFNCSDIHHAVYGNNVVALGTANALRLRNCPSGVIPPPPPDQTCQSSSPVPPPSEPRFPPCLDPAPPGYRRAWFKNRDLAGTLLNIRYWTTQSDGLASQQQYP